MVSCNAIDVDPTLVRNCDAAKRAAVPGGCQRRIENLLRISRIWSDFSLILVKYNQHSPQIMKKSTSNPLPLATTSILGQPPRQGVVGGG